MMMAEKKANTNYPIIDELSQRWSPRAFSNQAVEDEKLLRIFEAVRWAPSSRNEQPWRFLVARKGDEHYDQLFEGLNEFNQKWAWTAPVIGASLAKVKMAHKGKEIADRIHDVGLAMGSFLAQATHEGLHVHQMAGIHPDKILENFDIDGEEYEVVAMFVLGYQDFERLSELDEEYYESEKKPRERKPLAELISGNNFGKAPDWVKQ